MTGAVVLLACAAALWPASRSGTRRSLPGASSSRRGVPRDRRARRAAADPKLPSSRHRIAIALMVAGLVVMISPTPGGAVVGTLAAGAAFAIMQRSASRQRQAEDRARLWQLPMVLDVACLLLRSGAPPASAVSAAAGVCGPSLADDFGAINRLHAMGQDPEAAWRSRIGDPVIGPVARSAIRSADSGAALAATWSQLSATTRAERRARAEVLARKAGVRALAPLGLCFLPAFICLGVVPIVIGLAGDVFG